MTDELQAETPTVPDTELAAESTAEVQETNTETPSEENKTEESAELETSEEVGERTKKAFNKKHFQLKQAERDNLALQERLDKLEAQQNEPKVLESANVPDIPDSWDDDYQDKIRQRDAVIAQNAEYNVNQQINERNEAAKVQAEQAKQQERTQTLTKTFSDNVLKLGVNEEKVMEAAKTLVDYGADGEIASAMMTDPDGALMIQYFAADLQEFDGFMKLSPMERGRRFESIKQKAQTFRPKTSEAPAPAQSISGKTPPSSRGPAGATFE